MHLPRNSPSPIQSETRRWRWQLLIVPIVGLLALGASSALAGPVAKLEPQSIELGEVLRGEKAIARFTVSNVGDEPLEISNVKPSCGCTAVEYPDVVAPGASAEVLLTFKNDNLSGVQRNKADISTNDPNNPMLVASFSANVNGSVYIRPSPRIRLSNRRESLSKTEVLIERDHLDSSELKISDVSVDNSFVKVEAVELNESYSLGPRQETGRKGDWLLRFELVEDPPFGWSEGTVRFKTGMSIQPMVQMPLRMENVPPVHLSEEEIELPSKGPMEKMLLLTLRRELDPKKLRVESKTQGLDVELVPAGERHFRLRVQWDGTQVGDDSNVVFAYEEMRYAVAVRQTAG